jgi:hypothetical protein
MSKRRDHGKNIIGKVRIQPFAKSFILQVYDVLARHNRKLAEEFIRPDILISIEQAFRVQTIR